MSLLGEAIKNYIVREIDERLKVVVDEEEIEIPKSNKFIEDMKKRNEELLNKIQSRDYASKK